MGLLGTCGIGSKNRKHGRSRTHFKTVFIRYAYTERGEGESEGREIEKKRGIERENTDVV